MIKVMIVEDSKTDRLIMKKMIEKTGLAQITSEATSGMEALKLRRIHEPQVVVMDIDLPDISGLDAASAMIEEVPGLIIIFATSHRDYMAMAFDYFAFDYIIKPFEYERIQKTLYRATFHSGEREVVPCSSGEVKGLNSNGQSYPPLLTDVNGILTVLNPNDIVMITRVARKTEIVTKNTIIISQLSLDQLERRLPSFFLRTHRGFIVNYNHICEIEAWGRKTLIISFEGISQTALVTQERMKALKARFIEI